MLGSGVFEQQEQDEQEQEERRHRGGGGAGPGRARAGAGAGERGPCGGGGRGPGSGPVRAALCAHRRPARHRGGRQSACIVRAPREPRAPGGRGARRGGRRRRRLRSENKKPRAPCASLRAGTPSAPHSLRFRFLEGPFPPSPWPETPGRDAGEGRKRVLEERRTAATGPGGEPPAPRSSTPRPARRALPPLRLAGRQAGHRALALPPARSGHASSVATANPPLALVRLPPAPPNQRALLSVDQSAPLPTSRAPPPSISLLQSPEAL